MLAEFDLLTLDQVARMLRVSKAHGFECCSWTRRGRRRRKLVRRATLESWLKENDRIASSSERGRKSA